MDNGIAFDCRVCGTANSHEGIHAFERVNIIGELAKLTPQLIACHICGVVYSAKILEDRKV